MKIHKNPTGSSWEGISAFWTGPMRSKIMKFNTVVLLVGTCLSQVNAHTYGQQVTINRKKAPLEQVIKDLERQSNYVFLYDKEVVEKIKNIDVSFQNKPFQDALNQILKNTDLKVDFFNNTIVLKKVAGQTTNKSNSTTQKTKWRK